MIPTIFIYRFLPVLTLLISLLTGGISAEETATKPQNVLDFQADLSLASKFHYKASFFGPNLHFNHKTQSLHFKCERLFKQSAYGSTAENVTWPPPRKIPEAMKNAFTFDGAMKVYDYYWEEKHNGGGVYTWSKEQIETLGKGKSHCGIYDLQLCGDTIEKYTHFIKGKRGYVFGTQEPWAEASLIAAGASFITTIEYMEIKSSHPQVVGFHPAVIAKKFLNGTHELADFGYAYSSYEHDGLGRYGDPINPYADMESIARVHCLLKPGAIFFLGLPWGIDSVYWNAHRFYGYLRLFPILSNWEVIDIVGTNFRITDASHEGDWKVQPIMVLRKKDQFLIPKPPM